MKYKVGRDTEMIVMRSSNVQSKFSFISNVQKYIMVVNLHTFGTETIMTKKLGCTDVSLV